VFIVPATHKEHGSKERPKEIRNLEGRKKKQQIIMEKKKNTDYNLETHNQYYSNKYIGKGGQKPGGWVQTRRPNPKVAKKGERGCWVEQAGEGYRGYQYGYNTTYLYHLQKMVQLRGSSGMEKCRGRGITQVDKQVMILDWMWWNWGKRDEFYSEQSQGTKPRLERERQTEGGKTWWEKADSRDNVFFQHSQTTHQRRVQVGGMNRDVGKNQRRGWEG